MARYDLIAVYIVASQRNGTLYTGVTSDLLTRGLDHREGRVDGFAKKYGCKTLVWFEQYYDINDAIKREKQIKWWKRKWKLALNNARNVQQDLGAQNVEIEIVAYGPGIGMLKMESDAAPGVIQAMTDGVKVVACENTMRNQKLKREDMQGGIGYVGAGVVEIMQKQREGWAYLRP